MPEELGVGLDLKHLSMEGSKIQIDVSCLPGWTKGKRGEIQGKLAGMA